MSCHLSPLKNNYENSSSKPHHLMPHYLSFLKNNSKNSRKSLHATSPFSMVATIASPRSFYTEVVQHFYIYKTQHANMSPQLHLLSFYT
jgi:hypothetical protein